MTERPDTTVAATSSANDLDRSGAQLAYTIIEALLEHTRVTNDLIALMAQVLDQETTKAVTSTPHWSAYLDSRRTMERTRADLEKFVGIMNSLGDEEGGERAAGFDDAQKSDG